MPHFILEYSTNIDKETLAIQALFTKLHNTAAGTGLFPLKGMRSRAHPCDDFRLADGNPEHMFAHLSVLIGVGRSPEERAETSKLLFSVLSDHFDHCFSQRGVALSLEMKELEAVTKYNRNNVGDYL